MTLPALTSADVLTIFPGLTNIRSPLRGGQKLVFPVTHAGKELALKILLVKSDDESEADQLLDEVVARVNREVAILQKCASPYIVKLGTIPLGKANIREQRLIYFSEELIEGSSLQELIKQGTLDVPDLIKLGLHINTAIDALSLSKKVHRDIKPGNIMRAKDGSFILLDMGLAFDLTDHSVSTAPYVRGTVPYFSPEQIDYSKRRMLDHRSDHFALGTVLYEAATRMNPFIPKSGLGAEDIFSNIRDLSPPPPRTIRKDLPEALETIILRLLSKAPHLRYPSCKQLDGALRSI